MVIICCTTEYGGLYQITLLEAVKAETFQHVVKDVAKQLSSIKIVDQVVVEDSAQSVEKKNFSLKKNRTSPRFIIHKYFLYHSRILHVIKIYFFHNW